MTGDVTLGALNRVLLAKGSLVKSNTDSGTAPLQLTGADMAGAIDVTLKLSGTLAAGGNATLPTVQQLKAALPNAAPGQSYNIRIINTGSGAFSWTVVTNTGWTLVGTMTIAQNTFRDFYITFGANNTATLESVGTGTYS